MKQSAPLTVIAGIEKFGAMVADACGLALSGIGATPVSVKLETFSEREEPDTAIAVSFVRFESELGSLTARLSMDQQTASALLEAAMGGTGAEPPFALAERPLSKIEKGVAALAWSAMGSELSRALAAHLNRPFSTFQADELGGIDGRTGGLVEFRFYVSLFSYGGDLRVAVARSELEAQLGAAHPHIEDIASAGKRQSLHRELGKSAMSLSIALAPETFSLEDIAALQPGRILELIARASSPVTVWSGGVAAYEGTLARNGDRLAVVMSAPPE